MGRETVTAKQARFIAEYLIDLNGSEAAVRAGYSRGSAQRIASRLLREPHIKAEVQRLQAEQLEKAGITAEGVLEQLRRIAFFDPTSIYHEQGNVMQPKGWPSAARAAVSSYDTITRGSNATARETVIKVKFESRLQALELLAKHLGLLTHQPQVDNHVTITWLAPEPKPEPHVETVDADAGPRQLEPMGPPQGFDAGQAQSLPVEEKMGLADPPRPLPHRTHASSFSETYGVSSSSVEEEIRRSMEATGMSRRAIQRLLPELRASKHRG